MSVRPSQIHPGLDSDRTARPDKLQKPLTPAVGAYIVFTLDPVATLEALEDPVATAQARALPVRKFVGYVAESVDLPSPYRRYHTCMCILLSQGLPEANPADFVDESMCVAVAPAQHPEGRPSVTVSPPLPWNNLYHHTRLALKLRIPSRAGDFRTCSLLSYRELFRILMSFDKDGRRLTAMRQEHEAVYSPPRGVNDGDEHEPASPKVEPPVIHDSAAFAVEANDDDGSSISEQPAPDSDSDFSAASGETLDLVFEQGLAGHESRKDRFRPVAEYSTNLSDVTEFCDAKHIFEEIAAIKKIRKESEQRSRLRMESFEEQRLEGLASKESSSSPSLTAVTSSSGGPAADRKIKSTLHRWVKKAHTMKGSPSNADKKLKPACTGIASPLNASNSPLHTLRSVFLGIVSALTLGCISSFSEVTRELPMSPTSSAEKIENSAT